MRALAMATTTLLLMAMIVPGCTYVRRCKQNTLLVRLTLDANSAKADELAVTVSIDGVPYVNPPIPHTPGAMSGDLQVDFPAGYQAGSQAVIEVVALLANVELSRRRSSSIVLAPGCTTTSLALASASTDSDFPPPVVTDLTAGADLTSEVDLALPPDDGSTADLTRVIDLAGLDFDNCVANTEDCFNNQDDDCDGLVDCDDPDCVGGATPKAVCVPDPGTFTRGTLAATCPTGYPLSTAVYQGLSSTCNGGSCGGCTTLTSSFGGADDCFVLLYAWGSNSCSGGTGYQTRASGTSVCRTDIALGQYHSADSTYYDGSCNNPSGTSTKNTPTWSKSELFCRGSAVGGGCIAGNLCVPKGPSMCVIKSGAAQTCPNGYNAQAPWYTGYDDSARTCQCSCTNTVQGTCSGTPAVTLYTDTGCSLGAATMTNACATADYSAYHSAKATGMTVSQHATCAPAPYASGTTTPTGEQTICCMP